jgi:hypothetical protein
MNAEEQLGLVCESEVGASGDSYIYVCRAGKNDLDFFVRVRGLLKQFLAQYEGEIQSELLFLYAADADCVVGRAAAYRRSPAVPRIYDDCAEVEEVGLGSPRRGIRICCRQDVLSFGYQS